MGGSEELSVPWSGRHARLASQLDKGGGPLWAISGQTGKSAPCPLLPPEVAIRQRIEHVCFVPQADVAPGNFDQVNRDSLMDFIVRRGAGTMNFRAKACAERR
jgi:hypothetical protein